MGAKYRFQCRSCQFQCISRIGAEVGPHYSKVVMSCSVCATIDSYTVARPGSINTELNKVPVCKTCHSERHLQAWDGLTCPHCKMKMRALGADLEAERPFRYW